MAESTLIIDLLKDVALPAGTAILGWFASVWRSKQKKEADILDNMKQILTIQKEYIASQDEENRKTRAINMRLEAKLDKKNKSIRKANWCKFTSEGDGCPVLVHEESCDDLQADCAECPYKQQEKNDNS